MTLSQSLCEVRGEMDRERGGRLVLVIGQMLELGEESARLHREMGYQVAAVEPDIVWFIGEDKEAFRRGLEAARFQKTSYFFRCL